MNPMHVFPVDFLKINFNIVLHLSLGNAKGFLSKIMEILLAFSSELYVQPMSNI